MLRARADYFTVTNLVLSHVRHIYDPVGADVVDALPHGRQVRGRVVEAAVSLLTYQRRTLCVLEDAQRAFVFHRDCFLHEFVENAGDHLVVKALSSLFNADVQHLVDFFKLAATYLRKSRDA